VEMPEATLQRTDDELAHVVAWHAVPPALANRVWSSSKKLNPMRVMDADPDAMTLTGLTELIAGELYVKALDRLPARVPAVTTPSTAPFPDAARAIRAVSEVHSVEGLDVLPVRSDIDTAMDPKFKPDIDMDSCWSGFRFREARWEVGSARIRTGWPYDTASVTVASWAIAVTRALCDPLAPRLHRHSNDESDTQLELSQEVRPARPMLLCLITPMPVPSVVVINEPKGAILAGRGETNTAASYVTDSDTVAVDRPAVTTALSDTEAPTA